MKFRKIISAVLGAAVALTVGAETVLANEPSEEYEIDTVGITFSSYEDFAENSGKALSECDDRQFMKYSDFIYLPSSLTERTEDISEILIAPTYCRTVFDIDGTTITSYHFNDDRDYSSVKEHGWKKDMNGTEVYLFTDNHSMGGGRMYYFEENGNYFALSVGADFGEAGSFMTKVYTDDHLFEENGSLYYINDNGEKESGLKKVGGHYYYFQKNDKSAVTDKVIEINSTVYKFNENGVCMGKFTGYAVMSDGTRIYYKNGKPVTE